MKEEFRGYIYFMVFDSKFLQNTSEGRVIIVQNNVKFHEASLILDYYTIPTSTTTRLQFLYKMFQVVTHLLD